MTLHGCASAVVMSSWLRLIEKIAVNVREVEAEFAVARSGSIQQSYCEAYQNHPRSA